MYFSNSSIRRSWRSPPSSSPIGFPSSPDPYATAAPPLSAAASTPFAQVSPFSSPFLICFSFSFFLWKNARFLSSLGCCSSLGFAAEADADASESTTTEDQVSFASASFAGPFPDAQPTGWDLDPTGLPESPRIRMSWADMAQEDELEEAAAQEEKTEEAGRTSIEGAARVKRETAKKETGLSREQREEIRFKNVVRKKDFICLERVNDKIVNILDGLELHTGVFSAAEQKRIVDLVYELQEKGKNHELGGECNIKILAFSSVYLVIHCQS